MQAGQFCSIFNINYSIYAKIGFGTFEKSAAQLFIMYNDVGYYNFSFKIPTTADQCNNVKSLKLKVLN